MVQRCPRSLLTPLDLRVVEIHQMVELSQLLKCRLDGACRPQTRWHRHHPVEKFAVKQKSIAYLTT